jgi:hypothetical protein
MSAAVRIHQDLTRQAQRLTSHVEGWTRYSDIWKQDRNSILEKFKAKSPTTSAFDEKFSKFSKVSYQPACGLPRHCMWQDVHKGAEPKQLHCLAW